MSFQRIRPGFHRDQARDIEIERQPRVVGGGRDITEWVVTGAAANGHRTWITTRHTLAEAKADIERKAA